jgi:hypothetical protein
MAASEGCRLKGLTEPDFINDLFLVRSFGDTLAIGYW